MSFSVQIHDNLSFRHDEKLLQKAESLRPLIRRKKVQPARLVRLVRDDSSLMGWGMAENEIKIAELSARPFKRGDGVILDFGTHLVGRFGIHIAHTGSPMDAPLFLRIRFAEIPAELAGSSADYSGALSRSWIQEEYVHLDELPCSLALPRRYAFRYVELTVIDTSPKWAAVFSDPFAEAESSVDEEKLIRPHIQDAALQKIYDVSVKTLSNCMQDVFEDGPKRDRRLWLGDLHLQALANYAAFGDAGLVKRCLYLFGAMTAEDGRIPADIFVKPVTQPDDTFLMDYSLFFVSVLYDYLERFPENEVLTDLYPAAKKQIDLVLRQVTPDGCFVQTDDYPVFIDWSNDFDKETSGQAVLICTLKQFLQLAEKSVDPDLETYRVQLQQLENYAKNELFDTEKCLFTSGSEREYSIASQVWMVLAHVLDDAENKKVMETAVKQFFPVRGIATPYMYHYIAQALFEAGLTEEGTLLLKNYWGGMIAKGADTYWEAYDPDQADYSPYGDPAVSSYCHAWGCTPAYLIRRYLLHEKC